MSLMVFHIVSFISKDHVCKTSMALSPFYSPTPGGDNKLPKAASDM